MDMLRFVRSLEEFLYEAMTWLLFYPRTLWRVFRDPAGLAARADVELGEGLDHQFTDLVSPPLFLMLSILIAHGFEVSLHLEIQTFTSGFAKDIFASDRSLLIYRSVIFSLYPLLMAHGLLHRLQAPIDRLTLRRPFFLQCYFAGPFAILNSMGVDLWRVSQAWSQFLGVGVCLAAALWYVAVQGQWFAARLGVGRLRGILIAVKLTAGAFVISLVLALAVFAPQIGEALRN